MQSLLPHYFGQVQSHDRIQSREVRKAALPTVWGWEEEGVALQIKWQSMWVRRERKTWDHELNLPQHLRTAMKHFQVIMLLQRRHP